MTPVLTVDQQTYDEVMLASRLSGVDPSIIVKNAIRLAASGVDQKLTLVTASPSSPIASQKNSPITSTRDSKSRIYTVYKRRRVEAVFQHDTETVTVTSEGRLHNMRFASPSRAAMEVVAWINPNRRHIETNGWNFWLDEHTDEPIGKVFRQ